MLGVDTHRLLERLSAVTPFRTVGTVRSARGLVLSCRLPAAVGDQCEILSAGRPPMLGEVIGFSEQLAALLLYDAADDIHPGMTVLSRGHALRVQIGAGL